MAINIDVHNYGWYDKCVYIGRLIIGYQLNEMIIGITLSSPLNHTLLFHIGPFRLGYDFIKYGVEEWPSK